MHMAPRTMTTGSAMHVNFAREFRRRPIVDVGKDSSFTSSSNRRGRGIVWLRKRYKFKSACHFLELL